MSSGPPRTCRAGMGWVALRTWERTRRVCTPPPLGGKGKSPEAGGAAPPPPALGSEGEQPVGGAEVAVARDAGGRHVRDQRSAHPPPVGEVEVPEGDGRRVHVRQVAAERGLIQRRLQRLLQVPRVG